MTTLYRDNRIWVCTKPPGVLSTDQPGGMPELLRRELGDETACIRTVHRLDAAVGGVMVFARSRMAASLLSRQMRNRDFSKTYLAVLLGAPPGDAGELTDLLGYDRQRRMAFVAPAPDKDVKEARLSYRVLAQDGEKSLVEVQLHTGRTHQIRIQFASRGFPLWGDRKYGPEDGASTPALWSCSLTFSHPQTGAEMTFSAPPPNTQPWACFSQAVEEYFK